MFEITSRARGVIIIVCIFGFSIAITPALSDMDLLWAGKFFSVNGAGSGWLIGQEAPWKQLYRYGEIPPVIFALSALVVYAGAKLGKIREKYAKPSMVVMLTVLIGPGLLVNGILKESWGRPRPADIVEFGGTENYRQVWQPGGPGVGKSFTCGHCAMAFSTASGAAFYSVNPVFAVVSTAAGVIYGIVVSVARIAQGGHFATDALWSGAMVFVVFAALYYLVLRVPEKSAKESNQRDL